MNWEKSSSQTIFLFIHSSVQTLHYAFFFSFQIAQSALLRMSADFIHLFCLFRSVYEDLVSKGVIQPAGEVPPPTVPMDYSWARVSMLESNVDQEF